jgi:hypothetical protein
MLMTTRFAQKLVVPVLLACLCACKPATPPPPDEGNQPNLPTKPSQPTCDCSIFPPKSGCDSQCGIATGVVESVQGDSVTLQVPSVTTDSTGKQTAIMTRRTFLVGAAEAKQLQSIAPGARVALTFQKEIGQNSVKSVRAIPRELVK